MAVIPLMILIVNGVQNFSMPGFLLGILSALFGALFSILNKKYISSINVNLISFYEFLGVLIFITPFFIYDIYNYNSEFTLISDYKNLILILVLSVLCTNFAYYVAVKSLEYLPVFRVNLIVSLEPVYGIFLAFVFFNEAKYLNLKFYIGSVLILTMIFIHPYLKVKDKS